MSELLWTGDDGYAQRMTLWCNPCEGTHDFEPEQVELVVYALSGRLSQALRQIETGHGEVEPLSGNIQGPCLRAHLELTGPHIQAHTLVNVKYREDAR